MIFLLTYLLGTETVAKDAKETPKDLKQKEAVDKKEEAEEETATFGDLPQEESVLSLKIGGKNVEVKRAELLEFLKSTGAKLDQALPKSELYKNEQIMLTIYGMLKLLAAKADESGLAKQLAGRMKIIQDQMLASEFLKGEISKNVDINKIHTEAMDAVVKARKGQKCIDPLTVVCSSEKQAKEVQAKLKKIIADQPSDLTAAFEKAAKEIHDGLDVKNLKNPLILTLIRNNGWILPREEALKSDDPKKGHWVYLIPELVEQIYGKDASKTIADKVKNANSSQFPLVLDPIKMDNQYAVVVVVKVENFEKLKGLVEGLAIDQMQKLQRTEQNKALQKFIKGIVSQTDNIAIIKDGKKTAVPENVIPMISEFLGG